MALEKELATFEKSLPEMKAEHEGKFVLVHNDKVVDFFDTYDDAIKAGYTKFGLKSFLVKQIHSVAQVQLISRCVDPAEIAR